MLYYVTSAGHQTSRPHTLVRTHTRKHERTDGRTHARTHTHTPHDMYNNYTSFGVIKLQYCKTLLKLTKFVFTTRTPDFGM